MTMRSVTVSRNKTRLDRLKELAKVLAREIDSAEDRKAIPQLARQYRETLKEIEEIEGSADEGDEIASILSERDNNGKPGAVR